MTAKLVCLVMSLCSFSSGAIARQGTNSNLPDNARFEPGPARAMLRYWQTQAFPGGETDSYPRLMARGATVVCFVPGYKKEIGFDHKGVRILGGADKQLPLADQNGQFGAGAGAVDLVESDRGPALRFSLRIPADAPLGMRTLEFFGQTRNGTPVSWKMENALTITVPMVFIVDIDGMRQDLFYNALRSDSAGCPTLRLLAGDWKEDSAGDKLERSVYEHAVALRESTTIFPTVTIVGHASIFTGSDLRQFRMGGNGFFDRTLPRKYGFCGYDKYDSAATFRGKEVVLGALDGLANERVLSAPGISTVYQDAYAMYDGMESVVFHNMYYGDRVKRSARWEYMSIAASAAYPKTWSTPYDDEQMFERARKDIRDYEAYDYPRSGHPMGIMTLYANGVDHLGHEGTSPTTLLERQMKHLRETIDPNLDKFCRDVPEAVFKVSHFVFIADHGQTDLNTVNQAVNSRVRAFAAGRSMPAMHKLQDLLYEFGYLPDGDYSISTSLFSQDFNISPDYCGSILGHNGGMAHLYLRRLEDPGVKPPERSGSFTTNEDLSAYRSGDRYFDAWNLPPFRSQVLDVAERYWQWNEKGWTPSGSTSPTEPAEYRHSLELILVRDTENARPGNDQDYWAAPYNVYLGGKKTQPFDAWLRTDAGKHFLTRLGWHADDRDAAFLADRLTRLNGPMSGDLLLLPFYPFYYSEPDPLQGDHGSMMRQDFMVPFVVVRPTGDKADVDHITEVLAKSIDLVSKNRPATTDVKKTVLALLPPRATKTETSSSPKPVLVGRRSKDGTLEIDLRWPPFKDAAKRGDGSKYTFRLEGATSVGGPFETLVERHITAASYGLQSDSSEFWNGEPEQISWHEPMGRLAHVDPKQPMWLRVVYVERPGVEIASDALGPDAPVIKLWLRYSSDDGAKDLQIVETQEIDLWPGRCAPTQTPTRSAPIAHLCVSISAGDGTFQPFDLPFEYTFLGKTWHAWTSASRMDWDTPVARIDVPLRPGPQTLEVHAQVGGRDASRAVTIDYQPTGRPVLDAGQAIAKYVKPYEEPLASTLADKNNRDAKRFIAMLRDGLAAAVHDGYGREGTMLWSLGADIYKRSFGRELAESATNGSALALGKSEPKPDQMPASALSAALFSAGLARWQTGELEAASQLLSKREELLTLRAAAQDEIKVPWLWLTADTTRATPLIAQMHAWNGQLQDAIKLWDEYEKQYLAANPAMKPSDLEGNDHAPPEWYSPKNRGAPVAPPVVGGGGRPIPGELRLPGEDRGGGVAMPHEEEQPPPHVRPPGVGGGADDGVVPPPVTGNPLGQGNPPNPEELERARSLAREGKPQEALAQFDALVARAPQDAALRSERGTMRMWSNDLRGAREDWAAIASQAPDNVDARKFAAALELVAGDPRTSLAQYQELARARPSDPLVLLGLGQACLWTGDSTGAQKSFQQALQLSPDLPKSLYEQANQMLSANVPAIAHVQYTTVVWLDPSAYHAYYGLGFAASKLGNKQQAIEAFERYLQSDSSSQFAENARGELARLRSR